MYGWEILKLVEVAVVDLKIPRTRCQISAHRVSRILKQVTLVNIVPGIMAASCGVPPTCKGRICKNVREDESFVCLTTMEKIDCKLIGGISE